jgi:hypothetical protein
MKKSFALICACALCACASIKNTLGYRMSKYPAEQYIVKTASLPDKEQTKTSAKGALRGLFDQLPPCEGSDVRREAVLSAARLAQWWKDGFSNKYYAIAVLERAPAQRILQPYYASLDARLAALTDELYKETDKFARLKKAAPMAVLFDERARLDAEYELISFDGAPYKEEDLYYYKAAYNKAFYSVKINVTISGIEDMAVKTSVIDAFNDMGFAVSENMPFPDIELAIAAKTHENPAKSAGGLFWSASSISASIKDASKEGIFATLDASQRASAARPRDALMRGLLLASQKAASMVKEKILAYVQNSR